MSTVYIPALHLKQVNYAVNNLPIIKNITGSFPEGKITTLVGPSGAGKTTLLKLCNGLISPTAGDIFVQDKMISNYEPVQLRRDVGIVLQNTPMIRGTVYHNLELPLKLQEKKLHKEDAIKILADVDLEKDLLNREIDSLSGGQRQKVSIARTLLNHSKILLLDEITSSLDRTSLHEIEQLIIKINQKYGTTIVWITHNIEQAISIGDYTWVLIDGRLIETGESTILDSPINKSVKEFVAGGLTTP